ncbi:glycoside hydrolase family 39 protein [Periconia macrospinosa]|uniref:Glycoside hydrolase family 39 protein n=1 Tax=Periconia macrospinosa TaxID=97972 RepID=A0A2V1E1W5_9PLEO|nr:glycoside hydrolase family 39 protein [Periconia macrospinosa]
MRTNTISSILLSCLTLLDAASIRRAAKGVATVDLSKTTGPAKFLASGWIYGFPDNGVEADTSIPTNYIADIKFGSSRAGGAQTPSRGWVNGGYNSYLPRFKSTLSNYRTTRKYNGDFILLVHDLWGADGSSIPRFPGDNGNWTETDAFLTQLAKDIKANNMLDGLVLDLWNEPDIDIFWAPNYPSPYRKNLPSTIISGPSAAHPPSTDSNTWQTWVSTIASKNAIPDIYSWHQIGDWSRQPDATIPDFNTLRSSQKLPERPIDINEYAAKEEQNPGNSVYYIAQLERYNLRGLRANWGSGSGLHDSLADLVFKKSGAGYRPNGEWQLYKYYAGMTGERVATKATADSRFDVFATKSADGLVKVIAGTRSVKGQYDIQVKGLTGSSVSVATYRFDWAGPAGEVGSPVALGSRTVNVSGGLVTISVDPASNATAYAYEISGAK